MPWPAGAQVWRRYRRRDSHAASVCPGAGSSQYTAGVSTLKETGDAGLKGTDPFLLFLLAFLLPGWALKLRPLGSLVLLTWNWVASFSVQSSL